MPIRPSKASARRRRAESAVVKVVRPQVADRDGYCRLFRFDEAWRARLWAMFGRCSGPSEWAHFGAHRRSRTMGMAAAERHTPEGSLMLCTRHHRDYDQNRLRVHALTSQGCEGPLRFTGGDGADHREAQE